MKINIKSSLKDNNFKIKKHFGQNFLKDDNILNNIVNIAEVNKEINVIEIGPGLGSLTAILTAKAKRVLCYEIDPELIPILKTNLYGVNNIDIINKDILKADINADINQYFDESKVYLVSNLPYYITTPIILNLLEKTSKIRRYVMLMQEEVADRITSKPDVKDYNSLSIVIQYRAIAKKEMQVSRTVFIPEPNVDSAVVKLDLYDQVPYKPKNEELFFKIVRTSFSQRRKTLANNLILLGITKEKANKILSDLKFDLNVRSEELTINDFIKISDYMGVI